MVTYYLHFVFSLTEHLLGALCAWHLSDLMDIVGKIDKSLFVRGNSLSKGKKRNTQESEDICVQQFQIVEGGDF